MPSSMQALVALGPASFLTLFGLPKDLTLDTADVPRWFNGEPKATVYERVGSGGFYIFPGP